MQNKDQMDRALENDYVVNMTKAIGTCLAVAFAVLVAGVTYCGSRPDVIDPNNKIKVDADSATKKLCITSGGSWMPVITDRSGTESTWEMSCVKPDTHDIVAKMNTPPLSEFSD